MSGKDTTNPSPPRSDCPVACVLDLIGDRWSLLVVRDLLMGKRRFGDFLAAPEGIPTNILADRLKRFEQAGLVERSAYQTNPVRYEYTPTEGCRELKSILLATAEWGNKYIPGTRTNWPGSKR